MEKSITLIPYFNGLRKAVHHDVLYSFKVNVYDKGTILFRDGEKLDKIHIILEGAVKVYVSIHSLISLVNSLT